MGEVAVIVPPETAASPETETKPADVAIAEVNAAAAVAIAETQAEASVAIEEAHADARVEIAQAEAQKSNEDMEWLKAQILQLQSSAAEQNAMTAGLLEAFQTRLTALEATTSTPPTHSPEPEAETATGPEVDPATLHTTKTEASEKSADGNPDQKSKAPERAKRFHLL